MHRCALLLPLVSLLFSACAPTVVPIASVPVTTPTSQFTPSPVPSPVPTQIPGAKLGVGPDVLRAMSITVWHGLDGQSAGLFAQMAAEFTLTNSWGIKVAVVPQQNLALLADAVTAALRTPEHPDLVLALPEHAMAWDAQGVVVDLSPYVANPDSGFSKAELADIPAAFWNQDELDGKRLGVPAVRTARFLFYNVSFAKQLGFSAPPQTAGEFRQQACAANASWKTDKDQTNDGYGGWVLDSATTDANAPWTAYAWLRAMGGEVYADGKFAFSTSQNQSALAFLARLRADGCAWLSSSPANYDALPSHKALFAAGSLDELGEQRAAFAGSSDQWMPIAFPGSNPTIIPYGPDYVILKSSAPRQLAAWLFVRWMLLPENQARWARETGLFPLRTSAVGLLPNIRNADPQWAAGVDLLAHADLYPQAAGWRMARVVLGDGFFSLLQPLAPTANDATQTLDQIDSTVKELAP